MSKLEELIKKMCPDGVEYKKLKEVTDFVQGFAFKNNTFKNEGIGLVRTTNIQDKSVSKENMIYIDQKDYVENLEKYIIRKDRILIGMSGTIKVGMNSSDELFYLNQRVGMFIPNEKIINNKFLFYILDNSIPELYNLVSGSSVKNLSSNTLNDFRIAVPPLEVQCEIVHILDDFTLLSAELSAELKARRKQFNYYRDELIKTAHGAEYKTLKEIATDMYRGAGIKRDEVTETGIPCVRYGEIYTTYNVLFDSCVSHTDETKQKSKKYFEYGDVLFAITGESVEEIGKSTVYLGNDKCLAGGDTVVMKHNENPKYIGYALSTTEAQMQKSKGKVKSKVVHSSVPALKEISIPIPSLKEQERIASLIENFDKICNDLSEGLPAEIEKRQKQYEYYRDKLLSFKEVEEDV